MKRTERVKIVTGLKCNLKCRFCYYFDFIQKPNPPINKVKRDMAFAIENGIKDIDFSGGEPTIRPDFPELVSYAKKLGFRHTCVITNGIVMSNENYTKKLVELGLNDVLLSIHGHNSRLHDSLTQFPGSFERALKTASIIKKMGIKLRTNTVVNRVNYKQIPRVAELLFKLNPAAVNFILFNPYSSAKHATNRMAIRYSEASPYIKKAIDILKPKIKKITVRSIPFCCMDGYENYVCNARQSVYDPDEWAYWQQSKIELGTVKYWLAAIMGFIIFHPFDKLFDKDKLLDEIVLNYFQRYHTKFEKCKSCRFEKVCPGFAKTYVKFFGFE